MEEWIRGGEIGYGSFASINLAFPGKTKPTHLPPLMAVKSSELSDSDTLRNEMEVLSQLDGCPQVIQFFGDDVRVENGVEMYNLFIEYAAGGSLENQVKARGGGLPESEVRRHTRSILEGLKGIHSRGFVHCDIKMQNILVFPPADVFGGGGGAEVKIADFGLSKKAGEVVISKDGRFEMRGTPLYMSPESINENEYEAPSDVWALGCAVAEMATGKTAWSHKQTTNVYALMMTIGIGDETPEVPDELSDQGRDFLSKCFVKDPKKRWTAGMLLSHPFVAAGDSPRCHFEFTGWDSSSSTPTPTPTPPPMPQSSATITPVASDRFWQEQSQEQSNDSGWSSSSSSRRIRTIATGEFPNWQDTNGWIEVR